MKNVHVLGPKGLAKLDKVTQKWTNKKYILIVDGELCSVISATRNGNLLIGPAKDQEISETEIPFIAPAVYEQTKKGDPQHINTMLTKTTFDWPWLNQKMRNYMYRTKKGRDTTPKERNILADRLKKAIGVSTSCAWTWSKKDAPPPRQDNLAKLRNFDFEFHRL